MEDGGIKMKNKKIWSLLLLFIGFLIVVGTHIYILLKGLDTGMVKLHAIMNLIGAFILLVGIIIKK